VGAATRQRLKRSAERRAELNEVAGDAGTQTEIIMPGDPATRKIRRTHRIRILLILDTQV
jgi:hypothetical protein